MTKRAVTFVVAATVAATIAGAAFAADAPACATPEQAQKVQEHYKTAPGMPFQTARTLALSEAVIASALPKSQAAGTSGAAFPQVWDSVKGIKGVFLVMKGGNVFEIRGPIPGGEPSTKSKFFNLKDNDPGLGGHLRPDLITAIYAFAIPGKEKGVVSRAVAFMDASGESVFSIAVSGEGPNPPADVITHFDKVMSVVRAQPALCGK